MKRLAPALLLALAACSSEPAGPGDRSSAPQPRPGALGPLDADAGGDLRGELRCAFESEGRSLLLAAADVDPMNRATAVIALAGTPRRLEAATPGGFDALRQGGRFAGDDLRVAVIRGSERPTGHEGSRHEATLSVVSGESEQRYDGLWSCGP